MATRRQAADAPPAFSLAAERKDRKQSTPQPLPVAASAVSPPAALDLAALPPPRVFVSTPLSAVGLRVGGCCALLSVMRLYASWLAPLPSALECSAALLLFATFAIVAVLLLLHAAPSGARGDAGSVSVAASRTLPSQLGAYLQAWELLAADEPAQLLAALQQLQQLTAAVTQAAAHSHALAVLRFLSAVHRHLMADRSSCSPALHQLTAAAHDIRASITARAVPSAPATASFSALSDGSLLAVAAVGLMACAYVLLPLHSLSPSWLSCALHLLLPLALLALVLLSLLVSAEQRRRQAAPLQETEALLQLAAVISSRVLELQQQQQAELLTQHQQAVGGGRSSEGRGPVTAG